MNDISNPGKIVAVENLSNEDDEILVYHDKSEEYTKNRDDISLMKKQSAIDIGARPCMECFEREFHDKKHSKEEEDVSVEKLDFDSHIDALFDKMEEELEKEFKEEFRDDFWGR